MPLYRGAPYEYTSSANGIVFTAGACPLDEDGRVVSPGDIQAQAERAAANLLEALAEVGARAEDLVKTTIYVVAADRLDLVRVWSTVSECLGRAPSTLLGVTLLGYPDQLVEIEAVASIQKDR